MIKQFFLPLLLSVTVLHAAPVFEEAFEDPAKIHFSDIKITADDPSSGEYCGLLEPKPGAKKDVIVASGKKVIPVEPDQWYRLSVRTRNNIKIGELKFGLIESRSSEKRISRFVDYRWKAESLNITAWHTSKLEFKTAPNTHGVVLYIHSENQFSGSSWWDNIRLEKFEKQYPPAEIKPFRAVASFTDIPTRSAYTSTEGKRGIITKNNAEYCWEDIDPSKEKINIQYRDLAKDTLMRVFLVRGSKKWFQEDRELTGSGIASFNVGLDKLPEGIYIFRAELQQKGKTFFSQEKEIWRIDSRKCCTPKHEAIRKVSVGEGRQILVNGKIYNLSTISHSPTWGLFGHQKKYCKPDLETYMRNMQEQFGFDVCCSWVWRGPSWDDKRKEFVKKSINDTLSYLDFLRKMNYYGKVYIILSAHKKEEPNYEEIREFVRGVKNHPALLEWFLDEPEFKHTPDVMKEISKIVREEDPNHLININLCDPEKFHLYAPSSDIASYDLYPFPGQGLIESRKRIRALLKAYPNAPFESYLQMFNYKNLEMPSFDQLRGAFLLDRLYGAHTLLGFTWGHTGYQSFQTDQELQSYYRTIVFMFRRLESVLQNPAKDPVKITSSHEFVESGTFEDGKDQILILVNISNDTLADVSFSHPSTDAEDFFDPEWKYVSVKGKYSFQLKPNGTKVIRLKRK